MSRRAKWSGRRDLNSRPSPWQGDALPLSYSRSRSPSIRTTPSPVKMTFPSARCMPCVVGQYIQLSAAIVLWMRCSMPAVLPFPAFTASPGSGIPRREILSALSYALDLTEGAVPGHAQRVCLSMPSRPSPLLTPSESPTQPLPSPAKRAWSRCASSASIALPCCMTSASSASPTPFSTSPVV